MVVQAPLKLRICFNLNLSLKKIKKKKKIAQAGGYIKVDEARFTVDFKDEGGAINYR